MPPSGQVGIKAPGLSGQTLDGQPFTVEVSGDRTVLVFWASWCGLCRPEQPFLTRMAAGRASHGVQFVVDFLDHDRAAALAFVALFNVPCTTIQE